MIFKEAVPDIEVSAAVTSDPNAADQDTFARLKPQSAARRDLYILGGLTLAALLLEERLQTVQWFYSSTQHHDRLAAAFLFLTIGLGIFSLRRWREWQFESKRMKLLLRRINERNRELNLIGEMADLMQSCLNVQEASEIVASVVQRLYPNTSGAVYLFSASRNLLDSSISWGGLIANGSFFAPSECWALRQGRLYSVLHNEPHPRCLHLGSENPTAYMCVPMMAHGETIGVLHLCSANPMTSSTGSDAAQDGRRLATVIAEHAALSLANLRLRETLRSQSVRDPLTGLFNRRYLEESLEREFHIAVRNKASICCILFDLDHFKRFNDTFGHEAGDLVLREIGLLLKAQVRGSDIPCRYGGEEFALILPGASLEIALDRAEQLREAARHLNLQHRGQSLGVVTMSLGVAEFPKHVLSPETLLRAADLALYKAKQDGRDRVAIATST